MKYPIWKVRNNLYHYRALFKRWMLTRVYGMTIGENTRISAKARLDFTNPKGVHIGRDTSVTFDVAILTHDFVKNRHHNTFIGEKCFIGTGSIILAGVRIGNNCIVAAGSVVISDVPDNSIVAGNPARVVRSGIKTREYGILIEEDGTS